MSLAVVSGVGRIDKSIKTVSCKRDMCISRMDGVDLAVYKNRALDDAKFDRLICAEGGRRSLQAAIRVVRYDALEVLDAPTASRGGRSPVYFDGSF